MARPDGTDLESGGAAFMVAGNQLTATNAGAGILCAGNSLTVQNGGAPVQLAGERVDIASQGALLVAGCTVHAERSPLALVVGYDVHIAEGSQVIVAVSLRSFVDMLVGVAFLVPVQVGRRLARRAAG